MLDYQFETIKYVIKYPKDYKEGEKYPVIFFIHGAGTRGDNINALKESFYFKYTDNHSHFPFISIAPQCWADTWFDLYEELKRFIVRMCEEDYVDKSRVYLMGSSMGGYTTWQLGMSMPEMFAAIVPICGGGMYWNAGRLKNVPVWAFHGAKDETVKVEESIKMTEAVNKWGGSAKLTIYPDNNHDAWSDTYSNPAVFEWMLSNKNQNINELTNEFDDSKIYG